MSGPRQLRVATISALMVCIRFSAWSKTIWPATEDVVGDLEAVSARTLGRSLAPTLVSRVVERRQAVHELDLRVAGAA